MGFRRLAVPALIALLAGCSSAGPTGGASTPDATTQAGGASPTSGGSGVRSAGGELPTTREVATFDQPWAMALLPDGRALVTERGGALKLVDLTSGRAQRVEGTPEVADAGQGGLGDVALGPTFATDGTVYLTWAAQAEGGTQAVLGRAKLDLAGSPRLTGLTPIWRQDPSSGSGHYSHRIAIGPDRTHLFLSSGERQKMTPAQDLTTNLGKILRLNLDGTPAAGNPFAGKGGRSAEVWSYGHRNVLGLAFDASGRLWSTEMGPKGGDELNLVHRGGNYGWPAASNGSHYDGRDIPDHTGGDGFVAPRVWWNPSISPAGLAIVPASAPSSWRKDAFAPALSGQAVVRIHLDGDTARTAEQWNLGARIREIDAAPDGSLWLLRDGPSGALEHLTPRD